MTATPLVELRQLSKQYSGVPVVIDVDFDVQAGEVHALLGENGAGKSTLTKMMSGVVTPVKSQQVISCWIESVHRHHAANATVWPVPVVVMLPACQG